MSINKKIAIQSYHKQDLQVRTDHSNRGISGAKHFYFLNGRLAAETSWATMKSTTICRNRHNGYSFYDWNKAYVY